MFSLHRNGIAALAAAVLAVAVLALAACGSSKKSSSSSSSSSSSAGALSAEAKSAATGDIPDNQVFLVFRNSKAGYSIKYPEGWTQRGTGGDVTFQDKNNLVHIVVGKGAAPTPASVTAQLDALRKSNRTLRFQQPQTMRVGASRPTR